jgi:5-methylcytosine-specific restriction endonuclease McrA
VLVALPGPGRSSAEGPTCPRVHASGRIATNPYMDATCASVTTSGPGAQGSSSSSGGPACARSVELSYRAVGRTRSTAHSGASTSPTGSPLTSRSALEWYHSVAPARRQTALGQRPARFCEECGKELPRAATARKRFCDRHCINQTRMREKAHQAREHSRRRKRRLIGPGVSEADWLALVRRFDGKCAYCEVRAPLTQDHVVPVSRGGQHAIGNVVPACRSCNAKKKHRLLVEWRLSKTVSRKRLAA